MGIKRPFTLHVSTRASQKRFKEPRSTCGVSLNMPICFLCLCAIYFKCHPSENMWNMWRIRHVLHTYWLTKCIEHTAFNSFYKYCMWFLLLVRMFSFKLIERYCLHTQRDTSVLRWTLQTSKFNTCLILLKKYVAYKSAYKFESIVTLRKNTTRLKILSRHGLIAEFKVCGCFKKKSF